MSSYFYFVLLIYAFFIKLENSTFGQCKIMSIEIKDVFLGSESLKLHLKPIGVL